MGVEGNISTLSERKEGREGFFNPALEVVRSLFEKALSCGYKDEFVGTSKPKNTMYMIKCFSVKRRKFLIKFYGIKEI